MWCERVARVHSLAPIVSAEDAAHSAQTDPQGATLGYAYDVADNLTAFTDALSSTTNRVVDGFGEIIQEVSPARGTITSWYDCGGNLTKTVDAGSVETDYAYDVANRRTSMSSPGAISSTYVWDQTTGGSFGIGRLSGASVAADRSRIFTLVRS
jgi:YD repeat-containing protein